MIFRNILTRLREFVKIVRKDARMTEFDQDFLKDVMAALESGVIPKKDAQAMVKKIEDIGGDIIKMLNVLRSGINPTFLRPAETHKRKELREKREVVLSLYTKAG